MITEAAEIAGTDVSTKELLSMIGLVVLEHEVGMEDAGTTFLIMKTFPIVHHSRCDNNLVKDLPISLMLQGAFEAQTVVFTKQIDEAAFFQLTGMPCPKHVVDARVSGTVVQVAHHDDFRLVAFGGS